MQQRRWLGLVASLVAAMSMVVPVSGADGLSATLDGKPIAVAEAGSHYCHDFAYPRITCFSTAEAIGAALGGPRPTGARALGILSGYVTVYEHASYAGAFMMLSADQAWLGSIGWNDRISSFKSFGASGSFQEDSPSGGFIYYYGGSSMVPSLSGTYNDKFSSFFID